MTMVAMVVNRIGSHEVRARSADKYVDATALCQAAGKRWNDYLSLDNTGEFLAVLSSKTGLDCKTLVQSKRGNTGGTWIHPLVAVNFGQWVSPDFAVAVSIWVSELLTTGKVELDAPAAPLSREVELVRGELAQVQNRLDAIPATLAEVVSRAVAEVLGRVTEAGPLTGVETVASRLGKLLPHWNTTSEQRALIRNRARANVKRALGQEPLCVHAGSQLEFTPNMHYHLDTAIWQTYRQACRDNEVDDFGLYADVA